MWNHVVQYLRNLIFPRWNMHGQLIAAENNRGTKTAYTIARTPITRLDRSLQIYSKLLTHTNHIFDTNDRRHISVNCAFMKEATTREQGYVDHCPNKISPLTEFDRHGCRYRGYLHEGNRNRREQRPRFDIRPLWFASPWFMRPEKNDSP